MTSGRPFGFGALSVRVENYPVLASSISQGFAYHIPAERKACRATYLCSSESSLLAMLIDNSLLGHLCCLYQVTSHRKLFPQRVASFVAVAGSTLDTACSSIPKRENA